MPLGTQSSGSLEIIPGRHARSVVRLARRLQVTLQKQVDKSALDALTLQPVSVAHTCHQAVNLTCGP